MNEEQLPPYYVCVYLNDGSDTATWVNTLEEAKQFARGYNPEPKRAEVHKGSFFIGTYKNDGDKWIWDNSNRDEDAEAE